MACWSPRSGGIVHKMARYIRHRPYLVVVPALALGLLLALLPHLYGTVDVARARPAAHRPAQPAAHAPVDQEQASLSGGLSIRAVASQTIAAGRSGLLTRIDLPLCAFLKGSVVRLTVTRGPAHASAVLTSHTSFTDCLWHTFSFRRPAAVRRGERVRLTLTALSGEAPLWAASLGKGDPYRRGVGTWRGHTINDFAFQTYVQALSP
jgi:hypothetical protein